MKNDYIKFELLKLSIEEFGYTLFSYIQYPLNLMPINSGIGSDEDDIVLL